MPTGYTAAIADGIDFKTFLLNCARAFGACVMLRDEPGGGDKIPPEFTPSPYYAEALEKSRQRVIALSAMRAADQETAAAAAYAQAADDFAERRNKRYSLRAKYEAMLEQAKAWNPPTPEHVGLRDFMVSQIEESIKFDCDGSYDKPPVRLTGPAWFAEEMERAQKSLAYDTKAHAEELARVADRNAWIKALRESIK